jgi:hypothetical protein
LNTRRLNKAILLRLLKIAVAIALLAGLYTAADWSKVGEALVSLEPAPLVAALLLFVPQTLLSAWRWRRLAAPLAKISFAEALRQTLAASALNLVVPSKLGDLSKAAMLPVSDGAARARAGGLTLLEKGADVAALAALWAAGWLGVDGISLSLLLLVLAALGRLTPLAASRAYFAAVATLGLWSLHLLQIDFFLKAAGVFVSWAEATSRVPAAIFAGLAPISFWGVGARDSALVWMFSDIAPASAMTAVGLLTALRYLLPGLAGIPCLLGGSNASASRRAAVPQVTVPGRKLVT